jgi:hypothetical protein
MSVINNVVFNYVKIKKAAPKFGKKPGCPINDCEYSVDVCIPAATVKALKKKYKTIKGVKNMATYDAEDYKKTFKVEAPDADIYANADDEYSVMKLTAFAGYADGGEVPEEKIPRVVGTKSPTTSSDGKKIGRDIEVGNGSTGRVSFVERTWEFEKVPGLSLDLTGIQVATLVEYVAKSSGNENEFDFEEEDEDEFGYDTPDDTADSTDMASTGDGNTPSDDEQW